MEEEISLFFFVFFFHFLNQFFGKSHLRWRFGLAFKFSQSFGKAIVGRRPERSDSGKVQLLCFKVGPLMFYFFIDLLDNFIHFEAHFGGDGLIDRVFGLSEFL